jgi:predicted ATP-grasp superfamily ATP-dependent carboligase
VTRQLIIAAISARGYAIAAHAFGYKVITLDAFADADTRSVAEQCLQVNMTKEGVAEKDFKRKFEQITFDDDCQFIYGSLFDAKPALLGWVAERVKIAGNIPKTLQFSRSFDFFAMLEGLGLRYPEVRLDLPDDAKAWLVKRLNSSGGIYVRPAELAANGDYFQQKIDGEPVSLLFLADGKTIRTVGFNQQLLAPAVDMPYRFAGAVSDAELPIAVQQEFVDAAVRLTAVLGLRGLNSLDAMLEGNCLWFLELNPRLSATFQLYPNLLQAHMKACAGELVELPKAKTANAEFVLYADKQLNIPADFIWPDWVADIPFTEMNSVAIDEGEPVCTVLAEGEDAVTAYQLLIERVKKLKGKLFHD